MHRRRNTVLAVSIAFVMAWACPAQAEVVFNGGFETGNFAGWNVPPNVPPPNVNAALFTVTPSGGPHSGTYYATLASTQFLYISQILPTQSGTDYELSFWLRQSPGLGGFAVRWEGEVVFGQLLGSSVAVWTHYTIPVHANITGSFLEFGQAYFPAEFHIDDISVVQVPSPSAAPLLAAAGLVALRRKRRAD